MLRAHRQAWAWQDEWHGLTMDDIREIERQTQLALKRKMGQDLDEEDEEDRVAGGGQQGMGAEDKLASLAAGSPAAHSRHHADIPIIQTGDSSGDQSPEDSPNDFLTRSVTHNSLHTFVC